MADLNRYEWLKVVLQLPEVTPLYDVQSAQKAVDDGKFIRTGCAMPWRWTGIIEWARRGMKKLELLNGIVLEERLLVRQSRIVPGVLRRQRTSASVFFAVTERCETNWPLRGNDLGAPAANDAPKMAWPGPDLPPKLGVGGFGFSGVAQIDGLDRGAYHDQRTGRLWRFVGRLCQKHCPHLG